LSGVIEISDDYDGNTFRSIYTASLGERIYVLHVFQKKSKRGVATPRTDIDLIRGRLKAAKAIEAERAGRRR